MTQYRSSDLPPHRQLRMGIFITPCQRGHHSAFDRRRLPQYPFKPSVQFHRPRPVALHDRAAGLVESGGRKIEPGERRRARLGARLAPGEKLVFGKRRRRLDNQRVGLRRTDRLIHAGNRHL